MTFVISRHFSSAVGFVYKIPVYRRRLKIHALIDHTALKKPSSNFFRPFSPQYTPRIKVASIVNETTERKLVQKPRMPNIKVFSGKYGHFCLK
jgi:hypothetical protein